MDFAAFTAKCHFKSNSFWPKAHGRARPYICNTSQTKKSVLWCHLKNRLVAALTPSAVHAQPITATRRLIHLLHLFIAMLQLSTWTLLTVNNNYTLGYITRTAKALHLLRLHTRNKKQLRFVIAGRAYQFSNGMQQWCRTESCFGLNWPSSGKINSSVMRSSLSSVKLTGSICEKARVRLAS